VPAMLFGLDPVRVLSRSCVKRSVDSNLRSWYKPVLRSTNTNALKKKAPPACWNPSWAIIDKQAIIVAEEVLGIRKSGS